MKAITTHKKPCQSLLASLHTAWTKKYFSEKFLPLSVVTHIIHGQGDKR